MKRRKLLLLFGAGAVLIGAGLAGWLWFNPSLDDIAASNGSAAGTQGERKVLYWHDPMVPGPKFDKPGKSPFMDMELVPVYADEAGEEGGAPIVTVRPEVINNLGVRTYTVERQARPRRVKAEGYLFRDETRGGLNVLVDIFDRDADWIRPGLPAQLRVLNIPERRWEATVASVGSDIDIGMRSLKAVIRVKHPDAALKPNLFAEVTIEAPPAGKKLFVPRETLIRTGTRTAVVRALGNGRFQPVEVVAGAEYGEWVEIIKGLNTGDTVVTSGQFLLDSESSLRANFQRLESTSEPPATGVSGDAASGR